MSPTKPWRGAQAPLSQHSSEKEKPTDEHFENAGVDGRGSPDGSTFVDSATGSKERVVDGPHGKVVTRSDGKIIITEAECEHLLAFSWPTWKKWTVLTVIFAVQTSMNFNASVYGNAIDPLSERFSITKQTARVGQAVMLIAYAFGCELWAPWSEDLGRRPILQLSLFFVNVWQLPCALAQNFGTIIAGRTLVGISSAGGSVTLGMVADMWHADAQQYAVDFIVLSSVGGSVVGPIVGAFLQQYLNWRWIFWMQLIFGAAVQFMHFFLVPETRVTVIMDKEARRRRKAGEANIWGPLEIKEQRFSTHEILMTWVRPFVMFVREPIVLSLSLLSGFSDALIFLFIEAFGPVYQQWNFNTVQLGLAFIPLLVGYFIAYFSFFPFFARDNAARRRDPHSLAPERRLYWLLWTAPLEAIGLFGFAWTSLGPPHVHWIAPMIFSALIGIANFAIYMATIDYMVAAYGPYAASATGGNGFARDFLAGVSAMYATPFYEHFKTNTLEWPTTILACMAVVVTIPIYVFYWHGLWFRERSKFAQTLAADAKKKEDMGLKRRGTTEVGVQEP